MRREHGSAIARPIRASIGKSILEPLPHLLRHHPRHHNDDLRAASLAFTPQRNIAPHQPHEVLRDSQPQSCPFVGPRM